MTPQEHIQQFVSESIEGSDCFLVSFKVKPTNNYKIYIDSDSGFTLEKSISINRQLRKKVEEAGLYPDGDFSLEVSSPGIDAPLTFRRQYLKNIGRNIEITFIDEQLPLFSGKLIAVDEDSIKVEPKTKTKKGQVAKPGATPPAEIAFTQIKEAVISIDF